MIETENRLIEQDKSATKLNVVALRQRFIGVFSKLHISRGLNGLSTTLLALVPTVILWQVDGHFGKGLFSVRHYGVEQFTFAGAKRQRTWSRVFRQVF